MYFCCFSFCSDDLFAFSQQAPEKSPKKPEATASDEQKEIGGEDDEETIPFDYREKEDDSVEMIHTRMKETGQQTARREDKQMPGKESSRNDAEKTPEKQKQAQPRTPSSNRLTRSGRKRTLPEGKPEEKGRGKRTMKRAKFADDVVEIKKTPSVGRRDPYDFSDSQSNKTPSPMKKTTGQPTLKAKPTPTGALSKTKHRVEFHTMATVSSPPMPPKTATPMREKRQASKTTPATVTPSTRGRRTPGRRTLTSRSRHASPQVQAQVADESSPELTTDKPTREKEGVKFRKSPRKKTPKGPVKSVSINSIRFTMCCT